MAKRKTKVMLEELDSPVSKQRRFQVIKTVNRTDPAMNEIISEVELNHLIENDPDCTVEVVPAKKKRR
jgi:hypothetical protein